MAWPTSGADWPGDEWMAVQTGFGTVVGDTGVAYDTGYSDGYDAGYADGSAAGGGSVPTTGQIWPRGNP